MLRTDGPHGQVECRDVDSKGFIFTRSEYILRKETDEASLSTPVTGAAPAPEQAPVSQRPPGRGCASPRPEPES